MTALTTDITAGKTAANDEVDNAVSAHNGQDGALIAAIDSYNNQAQAEGSANMAALSTLINVLLQEAATSVASSTTSTGSTTTTITTSTAATPPSAELQELWRAQQEIRDLMLQIKQLEHDTQSPGANVASLQKVIAEIRVDLCKLIFKLYGESPVGEGANGPSAVSTMSLMAKLQAAIADMLASGTLAQDVREALTSLMSPGNIAKAAAFMVAMGAVHSSPLAPAAVLYEYYTLGKDVIDNAMQAFTIFLGLRDATTTLGRHLRPDRSGDQEVKAGRVVAIGTRGRRRSSVRHRKTPARLLRHREHPSPVTPAGVGRCDRWSPGDCGG